MDNTDQTLIELWNTAWQLLEMGKTDSKHAYNLAVLCSVTPSSHPRSRTIVLRNALKNKGQLWCYIDVRSSKAAAVNSGFDYFSWTFWDPVANLQFTGSGKTALLPADRTINIFRELPKHRRKAYATLEAPGTPQASGSDGLPLDWETRTLNHTDYAHAYFGVLVTELDRVDILKLDRDGHQRLMATRITPMAPWQFSWLVP